MKKIIKGKMYTTSTAKLVFTYDECLPRKDFNHRIEKLFRKRNGEFFLHGEGGGLTRWAEAISGNGWKEGENIIPLTHSGAFDWSCDHADPDLVEELFGEVSE